MDKVDGVVIGAGVVGLAVARALVTASPFGAREWMVLEAADAIGTGTSSRNSEVIHAGIYYPLGSLKAKLCVQGRHQLYDYLQKNGSGHKRCGKLIVATHESQVPTLEAIKAKGIRIYPILCNKIHETESSFRWMASETGGTFIYLDDISSLSDILTGICLKETGKLLEYKSKLLEHGDRIRLEHILQLGN